MFFVTYVFHSALCSPSSMYLPTPCGLNNIEISQSCLLLLYYVLKQVVRLYINDVSWGLLCGLEIERSCLFCFEGSGFGQNLFIVHFRDVETNHPTDHLLLGKRVWCLLLIALPGIAITADDAASFQSLSCRSPTLLQAEEPGLKRSYTVEQCSLTLGSFKAARASHAMLTWSS